MIQMSNPLWRMRTYFVWLLLSMVITSKLRAQDVTCAEIKAVSAMASAKSTADLNNQRKQAGNSPRAKIVYAARSYELGPKSEGAAISLLDIMPKNESEHLEWTMFGQSFCDGETLDDMKNLAKFGGGLNHNLARAVMVAPQKMSDYVRYAIISSQSPDSDFAIEMKQVCIRRKMIFVESVQQLSYGERRWFSEHVFDPAKCLPIALGEVQ